MIYVTADVHCESCKYYMPGADRCVIGHISILGIPDKKEELVSNGLFLGCEDYTEEE